MFANAVQPLNSNSTASQAEVEKEIVREFNIAEIQADLLGQSLGHLFDRLGVVMRPTSPEVAPDSNGRVGPDTEIGQRINSLTQQFKRASDVVGDILQRLELQ